MNREPGTDHDAEWRPTPPFPAPTATRPTVGEQTSPDTPAASPPTVGSTGGFPPTPPTVSHLAPSPDAPFAPPTVGGVASPTAPNDPAPRRRTGRMIGLGVLAVAAMVGSGVVGGLIVQQSGDDDSAPRPTASGAAIELGPERDGDLARLSVPDVVTAVTPSIVTIVADVDGPGGLQGQSVGTGVITTSDGEVITNAHVVDGATDIHVRLVGESEPRAATLVASDPGNDLALLRIAGEGFTPATFAQPNSVRLGDEVVVIGFALDLDGAPSVTLGIVSALDRTIATDAGENVILDGLIQTDAAISSGNSGGPLVNANGEVVGINTAVARGDFQTAATNIGFAISVEEALPVIEMLREQADGSVREDGYLGVFLNERTDGGQGAVVEEVDPGTPADDAGLRAGDIVERVDGMPVDGMNSLVAAIRDHAPGDDLELVVLRDGEEVSLTATLTVRPEA